MEEKRRPLMNVEGITRSFDNQGVLQTIWPVILNSVNITKDVSSGRQSN